MDGPDEFWTIYTYTHKKAYIGKYVFVTFVATVRISLGSTSTTRYIITQHISLTDTRVSIMKVVPCYFCGI